jgi:CheY-like chemotaxis protein
MQEPCLAAHRPGYALALVTGSILLVEDDPDVQETLRLLLRKTGLEVRAAHHGLDALRKLQQDGLPLLMVVDLNMPVMDGWDFLQQCPPGIPIVVLSGMDDVYRTRAHPDVVAVLQKPVTLDALLGAVMPLVGRTAP